MYIYYATQPFTVIARVIITMLISAAAAAAAAATSILLLLVSAAHAHKHAAVGLARLVVTSSTFRFMAPDK